ncbi:MAG: DUF4468 domain-containing protein [Prevotella sp.]|nr:DUF4468 domain-containing protein [Prevotella sp.]
MKKIFSILLFASLVLSANAQGEWEKPVDNTQPTTVKRGLLDKNKAPIDPKYLVGGVDEVNGKVCWIKKFSAPGKSADALYEKMLAMMQEFVKTPEQTKKSSVAVVNKKNHQIGVRLQETLVFANKLLSLDQTIINYNLIISCANGECEVKFTNISYNYEEGRETEANFTAEDMIADKVALNKKKTGFTKGGSKKFRTKTIDRKDVVFEYIAEGLKK